MRSGGNGGKNEIWRKEAFASMMFVENIDFELGLWMYLDLDLSVYVFVFTIQIEIWLLFLIRRKVRVFGLIYCNTSFRK